jgi:hypothetical protein
MLRFQEVRDPVERLVVDEDRTEERLFRLDIVRSGAVGGRSRLDGLTDD